MRQFMSL